MKVEKLENGIYKINNSFHCCKAELNESLEAEIGRIRGNGKYYTRLAIKRKHDYWPSEDKVKLIIDDYTEIWLKRVTKSFFEVKWRIRI